MSHSACVLAVMGALQIFIDNDDDDDKKKVGATCMLSPGMLT